MAEQITMTTNKYSFWIGLKKTLKNSAYLLIPFAIAALAAVPPAYAWAAGPVVYMLKNYFENKNK